MRSRDRPAGSRLCPACGAAEPIAADAPLWPAGWRCGSCGRVVPVADGIPQYAPSLANSRAGFDASAFDELVRRERGNFWFEPRNRLLAELAARHFPAARAYLEVGCGTGFVLAAFAAARKWSRLIGSEIHSAGLLHARSRLGGAAAFVQMDARAIPARNAFDLIGAFDVLEHVPEDRTVIAEVFAALVPGGGFLAAVPQHRFLWSHADDVAHHVRRYRRGELEGKLRDAGFSILFSTSYTALLLPLMAASRLRGRRVAKGPIDKAVYREFDLPRFLNTALRRALETEVSITLAGWKWPVGGSRIVVAQKPPGA